MNSTLLEIMMPWRRSRMSKSMAWVNRKSLSEDIISAMMLRVGLKKSLLEGSFRESVSYSSNFGIIVCPISMLSYSSMRSPCLHSFSKS